MEIDLQHKKLVNHLNELYTALHKGQGTEVIQKTLNELFSYTQYHFKTEEKYMSAYFFPGTVKHKQEHTSMIQKVKTYQQNVSASDNNTSLEVYNYLKS